MLSEEYIYQSIQMKIKELHIHPYGLTKDVIRSALDALDKMKIIEKYTK